MSEHDTTLPLNPATYSNWRYRRASVKLFVDMRAFGVLEAAGGPPVL